MIKNKLQTVNNTQKTPACNKNTANKILRFVPAAALAVYSLLMIWLLFVQRADFPRDGTYAEQLSHNIVLIPFRTTADFIRRLASGEWVQVRQAIINLGGNVIMFVPLGFLLPLVCRKITSAPKCLAAVAVIILAVELIQLFSLLGVCDVDDLLFNSAGGLLGYALLRAVQSITGKNPAADNPPT